MVSPPPSHTHPEKKIGLVGKTLLADPPTSPRRDWSPGLNWAQPLTGQNRNQTVSRNGKDTQKTINDAKKKLLWSKFKRVSPFEAHFYPFLSHFCASKTKKIVNTQPPFWLPPILFGLLEAGQEIRLIDGEGLVETGCWVAEPPSPGSGGLKWEVGSLSNFPPPPAGKLLPDRLVNTGMVSRFLEGDTCCFSTG